ncbi:hypothetical protein MP638_001469 [Amoeboaphelidium occidentale]|nr:hypothetical protein MP638_001469 [Amoeboaphelidium occidentale]
MNYHGSIPQLPQTIQSGELEKRLDEAISLSNKFLNDCYEQLAVFSIYWEKDDTGGKEDSCAQQRFTPFIVLAKTISLFAWVCHCESFIEQIDKSKRTLFVLHYAGHGTKNSTAEALTLAATAGEACAEPGEEDETKRRDFNIMKSLLLKEVKMNPLMDILMVIDCCCAASGGRESSNSGRVEFVAATTETGMSNAKKDGQTFTEAWCDAILKLKDEGLEFGVQNVVNIVNYDRKLAQYPKLFVLQQASETHLAKSIKLPVVVVAYHLQEDPESDAVKKLAKHLKDSPCPISVVAAVPSSSTLLVLSMPVVLLQFLPRSAQKSFVVLWTLPKMVVVDNNLLVTVDSDNIESAEPSSDTVGLK